MPLASVLMVETQGGPAVPRGSRLWRSCLGLQRVLERGTRNMKKVTVALPEFRAYCYIVTCANTKNCSRQNRSVNAYIDLLCIVIN